MNSIINLTSEKISPSQGGLSAKFGFAISATGLTTLSFIMLSVFPFAFAPESSYARATLSYLLERPATAGAGFFLFIAMTGAFNFRYASSFRYAVTDEVVYGAKGFLFLNETVVPRHHILHVSMYSNFIDKKLGLARVKIFTSGSTREDVTLFALSLEEASSITKELGK